LSIVSLRRSGPAGSLFFSRYASFSNVEELYKLFVTRFGVFSPRLGESPFCSFGGVCPVALSPYSLPHLSSSLPRPYSSPSFPFLSQRLFYPPPPLSSFYGICHSDFLLGWLKSDVFFCLVRSPVVGIFLSFMGSLFFPRYFSIVSSHFFFFLKGEREV